MTSDQNYLGWDVRIGKEDVECGEPPHEVALGALKAVALEHDSLNCKAIVVPRCEHSHREWADAIKSNFRSPVKENESLTVVHPVIPGESVLFIGETRGGIISLSNFR